MKTVDDIVREFKRDWCRALAHAEARWGIPAIDHDFRSFALRQALGHLERAHIDHVDRFLDGVAQAWVRSDGVH